MTHTASPSMRTDRLLAGILMIAVPVAFTVNFSLLQARFDYPDVLRKPAADVLIEFAAKSPELLPMWYGMFASAALFIPLSLAVATLYRARPTLSVWLAVIGVLAGLVQTVGLSRWVFAVPTLAQNYGEATTPEQHHAITTAFEVLNQVMGVGIGEHLGYAFTGVWSLLLIAGSWPHQRWWAGLGVLPAIGILIGMLESIGIWAASGAINAIAYSLWSLWLIIGGVNILLRPKLFLPPMMQTDHSAHS